MKRLRTVLVEDEGASLRRLKKMTSENEKLVEVAAASSGFEAIEVINRELPELVLLDIELKDMTAFEVLTKLTSNLRCQFIFITAYERHALSAFEVDATDYLLKPYTKDRFNKAIDRAQKNIHSLLVSDYLASIEKKKPEQEKIEITEGSKTYFIAQNDIIWVQADGYYSLIHKTNGSKQIIRKTLKDMLPMLPNQFSRVNRFSIINTDNIERKITNISSEVYFMKGNFKIKKSRNY